MTLILAQPLSDLPQSPLRGTTNGDAQELDLGNRPNLLLSVRTRSKKSGMASLGANNVTSNVCTKPRGLQNPLKQMHRSHSSVCNFKPSSLDIIDIHSRGNPDHPLSPQSISQRSLEMSAVRKQRYHRRARTEGGVFGHSSVESSLHELSTSSLSSGDEVLLGGRPRLRRAPSLNTSPITIGAVVGLSSVTNSFESAEGPGSTDDGDFHHNSTDHQSAEADEGRHNCVTSESSESDFEAELRKSNTFKQEIKHVLNCISIPIRKSTKSIGGGVNSSSVQLRRSTGCLT